LLVTVTNILDVQSAEKLVQNSQNSIAVYRTRATDVSKRYEAQNEAIFSDTESEPEAGSEGMEAKDESEWLLMCKNFS
jgi:hypothetical protein